MVRALTRAALFAIPLALAACAGQADLPGAPVSGSAVSGPTRANTRQSLRATTLLGLSPAKIADLLGTPDFTRSETPAQIWQYTSPECVLMLFFYGNGPGTPKHLLHIDSRRRTNLAPAPEQGCLDHVRAHQIAVQALLASPTEEP